jgi:hypothetical protein
MPLHAKDSIEVVSPRGAFAVESSEQFSESIEVVNVNAPFTEVGAEDLVNASGPGGQEGQASGDGLDKYPPEPLAIGWAY